MTPFFGPGYKEACADIEAQDVLFTDRWPTIDLNPLDWREAQKDDPDRPLDVRIPCPGP